MMHTLKIEGDGAHCGLTDWYERLEAQIVAALKKGPKYEWTTGWYASKKEIASAKLTATEGYIAVEVSVSDDFDTEGLGDCVIPFTKDLEAIRAAIHKAWTQAEENQKDNRVYEGFKILKKGQWVETYIAPVGDGHALDSPPGDNYHEWGFQGDGAKIPAKTKASLAQWAGAYIYEETDADSYTLNGWTIQPWSES